ncbi:hypothetical protein SAMN05421874_10555 [Nonomuraea maritima]|uniref:Uncharacterized protein n=1 Tax=Nonomuraea maritima TaxID=683260 RepID=A0A1G8YYS7_9ACTN|nr:hypothetical protein SAMN05421874_10555 [Nonomuraea maritima]
MYGYLPVEAYRPAPRTGVRRWYEAILLGERG